MTSPNPMIKIYNAETGEEIERAMTQAEYATYLADTQAAAAERAIQGDKSQAIASAVAKLKAIGLTADEIAALRG